MNLFRKFFKLFGVVSISVVFLITCIAVYELRHIKFKNEFESFFPVNDPDLDIYLDYRKTFEHDDEFLLVAIENNKGVFKQEFLQKLVELTDSLKETRYIESVKSPTSLQNTVLTDLGPIQFPYIHVDEPERYTSDSSVIFRSEQLVGSFFSTDGKSVCIFMKTAVGLPKSSAESLVDNVYKHLGKYNFDRVRVVGKAKGQKAYGELIAREFKMFFIASVLLLIISLYISFRSIWLIWIPLLIVGLATIWTLALMTAMGKPLDIMTVLLPTMMFVIGVSDVVHIVTKYLEELRSQNGSRLDALVKTIKDVGFVTFITLLTTSLGFLSLLNSHIIPIRDFGLYTSIGVFIGFVLSFAIVPFALNFIPQANLNLERRSSLFWNRALLKLLLWVFGNKKQIWIGTAFVMAVSIFGITRIDLNNYMLEGLTVRDEGRQVFMYFEKSFSGARPFEMLVTPSDASSTVLGVRELRAIDKLETYLKKNYHAGFLVSPTSIVKEVNKASHNGDPDYYKVPADSTEIIDLTDLIVQFRRRPELKMLVTKDGKKGRVTGKMHDIGSKAIREQNLALQKFMASDPQMSAINIKMTGAAVMLDKNNEYLVSNTIQGLLFSILVVGLIIGLIHKSLRMVLIAVIPNLLPIIFMGGLMGFAGIDMKSTTAIIFAIAFGIATDDTVHFLGRLKLELSRGKPVLYAIKRTYISTGKAVIVTSIILSAGFMSLMVSGFQSTFLFGMLISVTLLVAVVTDLLLFPLLAAWLIQTKKLKIKAKSGGETVK